MFVQGSSIRVQGDRLDATGIAQTMLQHGAPETDKVCHRQGRCLVAQRVPQAELKRRMHRMFLASLP